MAVAMPVRRLVAPGPLVARQTPGNPVALAGVLVTATIDAGPGTLSGNVAVSTNSAGTAAFSGLVITGTGAYTLKFTASGFPEVISVLFFVL